MRVLKNFFGAQVAYKTNGDNKQIKNYHSVIKKKKFINISLRSHPTFIPIYTFFPFYPFIIQPFVPASLSFRISHLKPAIFYSQN